MNKENFLNTTTEQTEGSEQNSFNCINLKEQFKIVLQ